MPEFTHVKTKGNYSVFTVDLEAGESAWMDIGGIDKLSLQIKSDTPSDGEIKAYVSLYNLLAGPRSQLLDSSLANPIEDDIVVQDDVTTYESIKVEKVGGTDVTTVKVYLNKIPT